MTDITDALIRKLYMRCHNYFSMLLSVFILFHTDELHFLICDKGSIQLFQLWKRRYSARK